VCGGTDEEHEALLQFGPSNAGGEQAFVHTHAFISLLLCRQNALLRGTALYSATALSFARVSASRNTLQIKRSSSIARRTFRRLARNSRERSLAGAAPDEKHI